MKHDVTSVVGLASVSALVLALSIPPTLASSSWQPLAIGAGGYVDGIDIAPDGTMVVRTDTNGAYLWNGTEWHQLVTATSMPANFVIPWNDTGVYEIRIAPSNTAIFYMLYEGYLFKSTNAGVTWMQTSFTRVLGIAADNYRANGQKIAVDPNNQNVVYVGTPQNGLFVTADGGNTWSNVATVPVSTADSSKVYPGITGIAFNPLSGVTNGKTNTTYAASYGNGVYESTNAGLSWTQISTNAAVPSAPSGIQYATVSSTGAYYLLDGVGRLWRYIGNVAVDLYPGGGAHAVTVDLQNPNHIVLLNPSGALNQSVDGGSTWSGWSTTRQYTATDIPWLASNQDKWMTAGGFAFYPLSPNTVMASGGAGVWVTTPSGGATVVWNSQSLGIENLVANDIIVPPGGKPVVAVWDFGTFYVANPAVYPASNGPFNTFDPAWSLDYSSFNPNFIAAIVNPAYGVGSGQESAYSNDGGQTWTAFATTPPDAAADGGTIAVSTPKNLVWAPANGHQPYYTLNGGITWSPVVLPGVTTWSGFDYAYYLDTRTVTADRVFLNTFYLYYPAYGVYKSTNGGVSWIPVFTGQISAYSIYNSRVQSVLGQAGNLFFTSGPQGNGEGPPATWMTFMRSVDGGVTWTAVPNVLEVDCFGFGKSSTPNGYPAIYIVGWVNNVYGVWQSIDNAQTWTQLGPYPTGSFQGIKAISGDPNIYGQVYVGFTGGGFAYLTAGE